MLYRNTVTGSVLLSYQWMAQHLNRPPQEIRTCISSLKSKGLLLETHRRQAK